MSILARQGSGYVKPWSLERDNQTREQLEAGLGALAAPGVVSGGAVTKTAGFSVEIAAGTRIWAGGALFTLPLAQSYTAAVANSTVHLWGSVARVAADQEVPTALDSYTLAVTHNTTGQPPSAEHFRLAILTTNDSGISRLNDLPPEKYVHPVTHPFRPQRAAIPAGLVQYVNQGEQVWQYGELVIDGELAVGGEVRID